jgi:hypothetical protein
MTVTAWHCLLGALVVVATLYAWACGWLYYRHKKPASSPVAMQQFVEPGVRHVREIRQGHKQERKERLLAYLCDCLEATIVRPEEVRLYLAATHKAGLDWREAIRRHRAPHSGRDDPIAPANDVTPEATSR